MSLKVELSDRERDTILAALRMRQEIISQEGIEPRMEIEDIATNADEHSALTPEEIDELCMRLNQ